MSEDLTPEAGKLLDGLKSVVDQAADGLKMEQEYIRLLQLAAPGLLLYKYLKGEGISKSMAEDMMFVLWRARFEGGAANEFDSWSED